MYAYGGCNNPTIIRKIGYDSQIDTYTYNLQSFSYHPSVISPLRRRATRLLYSVLPSFAQRASLILIPAETDTQAKQLNS